MAVKGKVIGELTEQEIFKRISQYDIFRFYMLPNSEWKVNHPTYSPFRNEDNPSFLIGNKNSFLYFIDFTDTSYRGNCFQFVEKLFNINYNQALIKIDKDFALGISPETVEDYKKITSQYKQPININKEYSVIQVKTRKFTKEELQYWNEYYQDIQDLKDNNIFSISEVYLNRKKFPLSDLELRFGYFYDGQWKIYRPFQDKKNKWLPNNVPITIMEGKENIKDCDIAFINKSKKDYMVIKKVFPCTCAVQNEGIACFSEDNIQYLKDNSNKQILSFDSDVTGVQNSLKITKLFDFDYCNVPRKYLIEGIKDWADLGKAHGLKAVEDYLKHKQIIK